MQLQRWIEPLVAPVVIAGLAVVIMQGPQLLHAAAWLEPATVAGVSLLLLGATAGLLSFVTMRRRSREIAAQARASAGQGKRVLLDPPENGLGELIRAVNDLLSGAQDDVEHASGEVKELQVQLKVAERLRRQGETIIHSINDAVLVTSRFDEVVLANEATATMFDCPLKDLHRKPIGELVEDAALAKLICDVRKNEGGHEQRVVEHRLRRTDGSERIYKVTLNGINSAAGDDSGGVVTVFHDMTRENEIARMKNDFVSSVSHELRTPLASIRAYVEMLVDGEAQDDATRSEFYDIINGEAQRLGRLIDNVLSISRIESGLVEIKREPLSLVTIIKQATEVISSQIKLKNMKLIEDLGPSYYQVNADRDMLYQAVMNLLSNAVKYTPEGGAVTIRCVVDEAAKKVSVRVQDTGVGIPAKDVPFVFDKFFRVEKNKNVAKGTGLGLSLVKNIVEVVHKGRMFVESEEGKGSCFGFEIDLC